MISRLRLALLRFRTVFLGDLIYHARRPLFAVWALVLVFTAWGLSSGSVRIVSGDAAVGGTKAHITSEFAVAMQLGDLHHALLCLFHLRGRRNDDHPGRGMAAGGSAPRHTASPGRVHLGQVRRRAGRLPDHPGYSPGGDRFLLPRDAQCRRRKNSAGPSTF